MNPGRNDFCPCGSGKKYKKCCGMNSASMRTKSSVLTHSSISNLARMAMLHHQNGQLEQAEAVYQQILQSDPNNSDAFHLLGLIAAQTGKNEIAIKLISKAISLNPREPGFHFNLGKVFKARHDLENAVQYYRHALALKPDFVDANINMGNVLAKQGKFEEAAACFRQVLILMPGDAESHYNLGNALAAQIKLEEAANCFQQALKYKSDFAEAIYNLGNTYRDQGNMEEAISCYRRAMAIRPDYFMAHQNLLFSLNFEQKITLEEIAAEHRRFGIAMRANISPAPHSPNSEPERCLRVGYVSADFRDHSCAYFFEPLLAAHDRSKVEIFCYSGVERPDVTTVRIKNMAQHWRTTLGVPDDALAALIRADQIDILVDLAGHTEGTRLPMFAYRPAPVQVTWLGYPNTTGLTTMDYRLTDGLADPEETTDHLYTERLVRLPVSFLCYQPPCSAPPVSIAPFETNGYITFGCFNYATKVTSVVIALWAEILIAVPNSKLILKARQFQDIATRQRYLDLFNIHGISSARLELIGQLHEKQDHLSAYNRVDIALDPFPYNGTTTTCEALWMGVPVVTLVGEVHAARVGASLLHTVSLDELVAETPGAYLAKTVGLANNLPKLFQLRKSLRDRVAASPLCDSQRFARDVEYAYASMWKNRV